MPYKWVLFKGASIRRSWIALPKRGRALGVRHWIWRDVKGRIVKWGWERPFEPIKLRWAKATIWYEGKCHGSYHIDAIVVSRVGVDESESSARARVIAKCRQNVMDALHWQNWGEIEDNLGVRCEGTVEDDGSKEEKTTVWRV